MLKYIIDKRVPTTGGGTRIDKWRKEASWASGGAVGGSEGLHWRQKKPNVFKKYESEKFKFICRVRTEP